MPAQIKAAIASKAARKPALRAVVKASAKKSSAKPAASQRRRRSAAEGFMGFTPYPLKKGEPYMNENQRMHFRNILLGWKRELMEEVDRTVHHMQDEAANFPDPNDRATQESEFSLELRTGYCDSCGVEIGIRRLEARPTATQCIDCKTLDESREKQTTG